MRIPFTKLPTCEVCGKRQAVIHQRCHFKNLRYSAWCDCCQACADKHGNGPSHLLRIREKGWKPELYDGKEVELAAAHPPEKKKKQAAK